MICDFAIIEFTVQVNTSEISDFDTREEQCRNLEDDLYAHLPGYEYCYIGYSELLPPPNATDDPTASLIDENDVLHAVVEMGLSDTEEEGAGVPLDEQIDGLINHITDWYYAMPGSLVIINKTIEQRTR